MLSLTARMINQNPDTAERIAFDYTVISSDPFSGAASDAQFFAEALAPGPGSATAFEPKLVLSDGDLRQIGLGESEPLAGAGKNRQFYTIFSRRSSHKNRTGDKRTDIGDGIFHYVIGSDRGLAKNFNFNRQDTQYFQEMLIESNQAEDQIQAMFLPQNVNISMYGNGFHKNGDLIFVDSRPALGSFAGPVLGIGGYYRVIRSSHSISNRGYSTDLECVFELRVVNRNI